MKALLVWVAVLGTAYVGYSYSSTDGESCLVCPMTGEPVFGSVDAEAPACCSRGAEAMLTSVEGEGPVCCSQSKAASCTEATDAVLTSTEAAECHGNCEKGCCKDKSDGLEVAADKDEVEPEVVNEVTATE